LHFDNNVITRNANYIKLNFIGNNFSIKVQISCNGKCLRERRMSSFNSWSYYETDDPWWL